jgi:hypothetical protein
MARPGQIRPRRTRGRLPYVALRAGPPVTPAAVALRVGPPVTPAADRSGRFRAARSRVKSPIRRVHKGVGGDGKPSCVSLAGVMCSRRERAFSTYQGRRTTALPSPCLDTLRTSANAHEVAPRARASPSSAQPLRGTRPSGPSQWAWHAPFGSWGTCITQP